MNDETILVCLRKSQEALPLPDNVTDVCGKCGEQVVMRPRGKTFIRKHDAVIRCWECAQPELASPKNLKFIPPTREDLKELLITLYAMAHKN